MLRDGRVSEEQTSSKGRRVVQLIVGVMSQVAHVLAQLDQMELGLLGAPAKGLGKDAQSKGLGALEQALRLKGADELHALVLGPRGRWHLELAFDNIHVGRDPARVSAVNTRAGSGSDGPFWLGGSQIDAENIGRGEFVGHVNGPDA